MKHRLTSLVLFLAVLLLAQTVAAEQPDYMQVRVYYEDKQGWEDLMARHLDIASREMNSFDIITLPEELEELRQSGFRTEVIHESLKKLFSSRLDATKDMGGYATLSEIYAYLDNLRAAHPSIVSAKTHIGYTLEGRDMWAVKISDNPDVEEGEPEVLYTAAIHAREVITPLTLMHFMDHLTDNYGIDSAVTDLVDNRQLWFVMPVNPDGYYHNEVIAPGGGGMWRKNRRNNGDGTFGVDLNRNYSYNWGYDDFGSSPDPESQVYRGTGPFSEPETQNMRDFAVAHNFVIVLYLHSYGNFLLYPWEYNGSRSPDHDIFQSLGTAVFYMNGFGTGAGGYNGGTGDWYYGEQTIKNKSYSLLFEIGTNNDGFWPDPARIPTLVQSCLEPCLYLAQVAGNIYTVRAPASPVIDLTLGTEIGDYTVSWQHTDTLNPAVRYALAEFQEPRLILDSANDFNNWNGFAFGPAATEFHSSPQSFYSRTGNDYQAYIQTAFPLFVENGDSLKFWTHYVIERNVDFAYVEVSTDGQTFTPIPGNITTDNNPFGTNRGNGITGAVIGWVQGLFDLSDYDGEVVWIRFSYETDESLALDGIWLDDIEPILVFDSGVLISDSISNTYFEFTGKPDGTYYYMAWAQDAEDQYSDRSTMVYTIVDRSPSCCQGATGNIDCSPDGLTDVSDVQVLVDHLFLSLAPLCCEEAGNINYPESGYATTDEIVDVSDLSLLIDNQFLSLAPLSDCP